ncbi:MAG: FAD-binding oxidoreductase, partial [Pseudomonadota bacterium]
MINESIFSQNFSDEPYWWRAAPPHRSPQSDLPERCDVVIVGSGFAGLCCAIELARAGMAVCVLDAREIGEGASTRAAGFLAGRAGVSKQINLEKTVGRSLAADILCEADQAFENFQTFIRDNEIDCDFEMNGRLVAANTPKGYEKLAKKMEEYNSDGRNRFEMVPRSEQRRYVNTDYYHGGMLIKDGATVHPAKYHAGLVRLCLSLGVRLIGNTRVTRVEDDSSMKRVYTDRGHIRSSRIMLGTGGYTDGLSPWHRRRVIPMSSTAMATERLGRDTVTELLPATAPVIDSKRVISYARPSPDGEHILFGGRARFTPVSAERSVEILYDQMIEVFPQLKGVKILHAWSGFMAFTFDFLPKVGEKNGFHYALACNGGSGIIMMSWLGEKAAGNILGLTENKSAFEKLPFKTMPAYS